MSYSKVHVKLTIDLFMKVDDGADIDNIISELDYDFDDTTGKATIEDTEIIDSEVTDSR